MRSPFELSGPNQPPRAGGKPRHLVVLLHGFGSDGNDLIGLAPHWAAVLPDTEFVSPNAPFPCEMGGFGHQWFSFGDRDPQAILAGTKAAANILNAFLDEALASRGLTDRELALVGFSQGTMMALYVALRRPQAVAAVVGYSGALVGAETLAAEIQSRPPVLLVHGDQDQVIPPEALMVSVQGLGGLSVPVEFHLSRGIGHGIDGDGLALGGSFLAKALAP